VEALGWECQRADEVIHNLLSESSCC